MIQVRKIQPEDLQAIYNKAEELSFEQSSMLHRLNDIMVVINNGEICGMGIGINIASNCLLNWTNISEQHRRDRMGTILVKTILNNAEQKGALQAYIYGKCTAFAESLGFIRVSEQQEEKQIGAVYKEAYGSIPEGELFKVCLVDYFKPCAHK